MRGLMDGMMAVLLGILSIEDAKRMEIPNWCIVGLFGIGVVHLVTVFPDMWQYLSGMVVFGGGLLLLYFLTSGKIIGAGDIKLLAACGLRLGFDGIAAAFLLGASLGVTVQMIRRKFFGGGEAFPMAPYLSFGIIWMLFP